mmetsp:Transcript_15154/g.45924  ORF Transcript_15154/g.45924 Transcript_15154/m.45924 type:complete len:145 (+) Transcript_15154:174-608(+)
MGCCCSVDDETPRPQPTAAQQRSYGSGQRPFGGAGHTLGGGGVASTSGVDATDAAAAAALERANAATGSGASQRDRKLAERRQKDDLIGKINAYYAQVGRDPPIGLPSSSLDQLRKHLDYVKHDASKTSKLNAKTAAVAGAMNI